MDNITIVLVLYNKKIADLAAYNVLRQLENQQAFFVVLYDNSLEEQANPFSADNISYVHDKTNPGLAKAYNFAWKFAAKNNSKGLLLLDDDTLLDMDYLKTLTELSIPENTGAVVPLIFDGDKQVSPVYADSYINRDSQFPPAGTPSRRVMAINSGALIPLKVLDKIGGFNEAFSLDFLDHWFFWQLHQHGYKIMILDKKIQHHLSVLDYTNVSTQRYQNILEAEKLYYSKYDTQFAAAHQKQLLKRLAKQFLTIKNRQIWRTTFRQLFKKTER